MEDDKTLYFRAQELRRKGEIKESDRLLCLIYDRHREGERTRKIGEVTDE